MNNKLLEFFKKSIFFLKNNWIWILIIVFLIFMYMINNKIANAKINSYEQQIVISADRVKELFKQYNDLNVKFKNMEVKRIEYIKKIVELENELRELTNYTEYIEEKYRGLKEKIAKLSINEKDKVLIDLLKEFNISVNIINDTMIITFENREKLLNILIDLKETKEKLINQDKKITVYETVIVQKNGVISTLNGQLSISKEEIDKLLNIIKEKDKIIKNTNKKSFWKQIKAIGTKSVPALLIGLLIGHFVTK